MFIRGLCFRVEWFGGVKGEENCGTMVAMSHAEKKTLKKMIHVLKECANRPEERPLSQDDILWLLRRVKEVFVKQPMGLEVAIPINICGDIPGQFADLMRLFGENGWPPKSRYLFLGDYVDRGQNNLETIVLLFALKLRYPDDFFLLRGNHESRNINRVYGFYDELNERYKNVELYEAFNDVFDWMPLSALIEERILCMHGGISPELKSFQQIQEIKRPLDEIPDAGLVADLLWADPEKGIVGFVPSTRGINYRFGPDRVLDVCANLDIDLIVRAHQVMENGYEFFANDILVTLFTAPDYCGQFENAGAILLVQADMDCKVKVAFSFHVLESRKKKK